MVAHLCFFVSSLVDSEGLIYGGFLLNFRVKLPFCDTEDMLLLFPVGWWFPGASLLFIFLFFSLCVTTSGVTYYLLKKGLSAWWITPALLTLRQGNRQIAASEASLAPLSHLILTVVSPPREPGPRNIPSTPFFVKDSFSLSHLFGSAAGDTELEFPQ